MPVTISDPDFINNYTELRTPQEGSGQRGDAGSPDSGTIFNSEPRKRECSIRQSRWLELSCIYTCIRSQGHLTSSANAKYHLSTARSFKAMDTSKLNHTDSESKAVPHEAHHLDHLETTHDIAERGHAATDK